MSRDEVVGRRLGEGRPKTTSTTTESACCPQGIASELPPEGRPNQRDEGRLTHEGHACTKAGDSSRGTYSSIQSDLGQPKAATGPKAATYPCVNPAHAGRDFEAEAAIELGAAESTDLGAEAVRFCASR